MGLKPVKFFPTKPIKETIFGHFSQAGKPLHYKASTGKNCAVDVRWMCGAESFPKWKSKVLEGVRVMVPQWYPLVMTNIVDL